MREGDEREARSRLRKSWRSLVGDDGWTPRSTALYFMKAGPV